MSVRAKYGRTRLVECAYSNCLDSCLGQPVNARMCGAIYVFAGSPEGRALALVRLFELLC